MNTSEEVLKKQNQIDNQSWNIKKKQIMKIPSYYGISIDYISELGQIGNIQRRSNYFLNGYHNEVNNIYSFSTGDKPLSQ